jgi:hypothetical protein
MSRTTRIFTGVSLIAMFPLILVSQNLAFALAWSGRSTHSRNDIRCCEIGQEIMYNCDPTAYIS